jgi:hypothetical protein
MQHGFLLCDLISNSWENMRNEAHTLLPQRPSSRTLSLTRAPFIHVITKDSHAKQWMTLRRREV